jgi:hypothetical protein
MSAIQIQKYRVVASVVFAQELIENMCLLRLGLRYFFLENGRAHCSFRSCENPTVMLQNKNRQPLCENFALEAGSLWEFC